MNKISIVFWSQSGNTEEMANAIGQGVREGGKEVEIVTVSNASINELKNSAVFALGCPAMGVEVLEEAEMEPFVEEVEKIAAGKNIALFGSYGWGDGQWMKDWEERMTNAGAIIINGQGLMCQEAPDDAVLAECNNLGKQLAVL